MDSDLLTAARSLAERGWLPDLWIDSADRLAFRLFDPSVKSATEADLHLAAHREIVRRGWGYEVEVDLDYSRIVVWVYYRAAYPNRAVEPGTTTLSLLRALLAACEAAESKEKNT